jgi:hypothetical protein
VSVDAEEDRNCDEHSGRPRQGQQETRKSHQEIFFGLKKDEDADTEQEKKSFGEIQGIENGKRKQREQQERPQGGIFLLWEIQPKQMQERDDGKDVDDQIRQEAAVSILKNTLKRKMIIGKTGKKEYRK